MDRDVPRDRILVTAPHAAGLLGVAVLAYFVLVGDLGWRDPHPALRITSALLASGLVALYVLRVARMGDLLDRRLLGCALLFTFGAMFSLFPRQSLDSVLGVLLYLAGLFSARGLLQSEPARSLFIAALMTLSAFLTAVTALQMIVPFIEWWALTDWTVFPPLDLRVLPEPWVFRYEMALLLVMLYPSWWIGRITRVRAGGALIVGVLTLAVCVVAGSRTVWFAIAVGLAAAIWPSLPTTLGRSRRWAVGVVVLLAAIVVGLIMTGIGEVAAERLLRSAPLAERASVWGALVGAWTDHPLTGFGAGSMPWILQLTDYFDTNAFAPRHADNAVVQLLTEGGIVGIIAGVVAATVVLRAVMQGRSRPALFGLIVFLVAQIGTNPTEYMFLMTAAIGWVAYATPRGSAVGAASGRPGSSLRRVAAVGMTSVIGIAFWVTIVAGIAYSTARSEVRAGDLVRAEASLRLASQLDPGMALYARQLGALGLATGRPDAASVDLARAATLNPSDDLAWRLVGMAYWEMGRAKQALDAVERAVEAQRSDSANLLLWVHMLRNSGQDDAAERVLAQTVQAWPLIVAAPGWTEFSDPWTTAELVAAALDRWEDSEPSPQPRRSQPLLLSMLLGRPQADIDAAPSSLAGPMRDAYEAVMACDPDAAEVLSRVPLAERRRAEYWELAIRQAEVSGTDSAPYRRLHRIMTGDRIYSGYVEPFLNPLNEHGTRGSTPDTFGYRRWPIEWPSGWLLPSERAGAALWHYRPITAAENAELDAMQRACAD